MTNKGIIQIHGKDYMTVARRVEIAHEDRAFEKLETEIISHTPVVVKATVTIKGKTYTGISAVTSQNKLIEKENPYEVAETSAVGRALGFAGYGIIESVASADEMVRATRGEVKPAAVKPVLAGEENQEPDWIKCTCGAYEKGLRYHSMNCPAFQAAK